MINNTKKLQNTNVQGREKQSTKAYLKFLEGKGATVHLLYLRSRFLDGFTVNLIDQVQSRKAYASALKTTMITLNNEDKQQALHASREFFPFWMNDIKGIAKFESAHGFEIEATDWQPQVSSLETIISRIESERFSAKEYDNLINYAEKLDVAGNLQHRIEKRTKLAKIILIYLRGAPKSNHMVYRSVVDAMLPLFQSNEVKKTYLEVAREFYHIWKDKQVTM